MTRPTLGRARWWVAAALALVGVFVLGATAVRFAPPGSTVAVWWPAAGLAVSFLLATARGARAWLFVAGVLVSSAAANAYGGRPPLVALCFGVANAAEVAVVYGLLTRGGRRPALASMEDLWNLLAATLAGALVFGLFAGLTVSIGVGGPLLATASAVTASHAAAVLVFAPLGIAVGTRRTRRPGFEDLVQWVVVVGLTAWVFNPGQALPLAFLPIPVLVWGALRLGLRTVAIQLLVVGVLAVTLTSIGGGPFAAAARVGGLRPETVGALTQAFLVTAAVTALSLAVASTQRRAALARPAQRGRAERRRARHRRQRDHRRRPRRRHRPPQRDGGAAARCARGGARRTSGCGGLPRRATTTASPRRWPASARVPCRSTRSRTGASTGLGVRHIVWTNAYLTDDTGHRTHLVKTGVDVTDERAARTFVEAVLEAATATAIIGTDLDGVITLFNRGAETVLGWRASEVVSRKDWSLLHDPAEIDSRAEELGVEPGFDVLVHRVRGGAATETRDWTYVRKDGTRRTVSLTMSGIRDEGGQLTGYLGVAEDVTRRRQVEVTLQVALDREREAVEELTQLDRTKSDFVSAVSHELRTPLASVLGYTEMLEDGAAGALTDRQLELVARVDRNGRRLLSLIEDLLLNSRIEAGRLELAPRRCDLSDVVASAWTSVETVTAQRDLAREVEVSPRPLWIEGDPVALERMVTNLLSNAVKFTPDGGRVALAAHPDDRRPDTVRLVVSDSGMGIPESDHERVFARFFRSSAANERAIQGSGLGLSIVRAIAEGHGGSVSVDSAPDQGSTFTVCLPVAGSAGPPTQGASRTYRDHRDDS